jgi:hypothetical protein
LGLLLLAGLLFVPLQVRRQRSLTRRSIWIPLIITGALAAILAYAFGLALWELADPDIYHRGINPFYWLILPALSAWAFWSGIFFLLTAKRGKTTVALALHRWLLAGSLLELLIAVPAHLIVRRRSECCAGIMTGHRHLHRNRHSNHCVRAGDCDALFAALSPHPAPARRIGI